MSWELLVGVRYLRSRRRSFLSLISALSLAGVTIGVATLLIVLAVMTGLEYDLRQKILGFNPHVTLASFSGGLADWKTVLERVREVPDVKAASPVVYGQAMLGIGRAVSGVVCGASSTRRWCHRHREASEEREPGRSRPSADDHPAGRRGRRKVDLPGIVIGQGSRQLGLGPGDVVNVISPLGLRTHRHGAAHEAVRPGGLRLRACSTTTAPSRTWRCRMRSASSTRTTR